MNIKVKRARLGGDVRRRTAGPSLIGTNDVQRIQGRLFKKETGRGGHQGTHTPQHGDSAFHSGSWAVYIPELINPGNSINLPDPDQGPSVQDLKAGRDVALDRARELARRD